jgi:hypothetical protein
MATQPLSLERLGRRVGDADREAVAAELLAHHLHGRLSLEELERREHAARDAVTTADLVRLFVDLPGGAETMLQDRESSTRPRLAVPPVVRERLIRYGTAPVLVTTGAVVLGNMTSPYNSEEVFMAAFANGVLGVVAYAWAARRGRRPP